MATISADPKLISAYGEQILDKVTQYKKQIDQIYSTVDTLKTNWTGAASQRFVGNIEGFKDDYQKFGDLINEFGNLLIQVGKSYQDLEDKL